MQIGGRSSELANDLPGNREDGDHQQHLLDSAINEDIIQSREYRTAPDFETLLRLQFSEEQAKVGRALVLPLWWANEREH